MQSIVEAACAVCPQASNDQLGSHGYHECDATELIWLLAGL